jgi:hypothetical protein
MRILLIAALAATSVAHAQPAADTAGIRAAAMDYIEGWYTGDAARMERALHPELAKRIVTTDDKTGRSQLGQMGAMTLINKTRAGIGTEIPVAQRREDFRILDIYRDNAVAKIVASDWIDYLELARWNGQWKIVNVLWALTPKEDQPR